MMKRTLGLVTLSLLLLNSAHAGLIGSQQLPDDLKYDNKPISPICFGTTSYREFNQEEGQIDLTKCIEAANQPHVVNKDLESKGYYGFDVKDNDKVFTLSTHYYRAFSAATGFYFIESVSSGDEAGVFSSLDLVSRVNPTTLKIDTIASGDRCNAGIESIESSSEHLILKTNLTPFLLMTLANPVASSNKAIESLANCETCCIGKAVYKVDTNGKKTFEAAEIDKPTSDSSMPACLEKIVKANATKSDHGMMLSKEGLDKLATAFNKACPAKK